MIRAVVVVLGTLLLSGCGGQVGEQAASVQVTADVPVSESWALLSDFSLAHNYVPGLSNTEIVSDISSGVGAHRRVYDADGDFIEETITVWNEGEGFTIRLHEGEAPMAPFTAVAFDYHVAPAGDEQTRIDLALRFEMPWGGVGHWLGANFIQPAMEAELVQVAAGMKAFYESGEPASDADREQLAPAVTVTSGADAGP